MLPLDRELSWAELGSEVEVCCTYPFYCLLECPDRCNRIRKKRVPKPSISFQSDQNTISFQSNVPFPHHRMCLLHLHFNINWGTQDTSVMDYRTHLTWCVSRFHCRNFSSNCAVIRPIGSQHLDIPFIESSQGLYKLFAHPIWITCKTKSWSLSHNKWNQLVKGIVLFDCLNVNDL